MRGFESGRLRKWPVRREVAASNGGEPFKTTPIMAEKLVAIMRTTKTKRMVPAKWTVGSAKRSIKDG